MIQREANFTAKRERRSTDNGNTSKASSSAATASWSRFKDPRIVRVSRALGGKDRHSKVCTVRGLRDRRVRLSVPTAIQLYDLQDRLGLNQPSKVVDWLLNVAKNEIDELPPLQIPQGSFINQSLNPFLNHHEFIVAASQSAEKQGLKISADFSWNDPLKHGHPPTGFDGKSKDVERNDEHHQSWTRNQEKRQFNLDQNQGGGGGGDNDDDDQYVSTNNFFSRQSNNPSSFPSLLSSTMAPFNSFMRWDPSNLTLSHPPISLGLTAAQHDQDLHNCSLVQLPPTMSIHQAASHQVLVYQPASGMSTTQPHFPSQISPTNVAIDLSNSSAHGLPVRQPLQFNMTADLLPSNEQTKHDKIHSS